MKKAAIVIGHRSSRQGAWSPFLGKSEYQFNKVVAGMLIDVADIYERPNTPFISESKRVQQMLNKINKKNYHLVISLHFNSFADPRAHGTTALYYITNKYTKRLAQKFVDMVNARFGIKKRSLIPIQGHKQRGKTFIVGTKAQAVLLEPFFGSNADDAYSFKGKEDKYAKLIRDLIQGAMRNKAFIGTIISLLLALVAQRVHSDTVNRRNERKINELYQKQTEYIEHIKTQHKVKDDSLMVVLEVKQNKIKALEYSLYKSIKKAKINNKKYEGLKNQARNISDADSLSRILSDRYQKEKR